MLDLQFDRCRDFPAATTNVKNAEYIEISNTFSDNIKRISLFAALPAEINYWSSLFGAYLHSAAMRFEVDDLVKVGGITNQARARANEELHQFLKQRAERIGSDPVVLAQHQWETGSANVRSLMDSDQTGELREGVDATFAAMISAAWAAFEVLCVDLWVAAVNSHPHPLATNIINQNNKQSIQLSHLAGNDYDLRNRMGSIFIDTKKISMDSFYNIQDAYSVAFANEWALIFSRFPELRGIEAIRHLFAHRSGRVDQKFLDSIAGIPEIERSEIGKKIELSGSSVASKIGSCVRCGVELVTFVDSWHKPRV